MWWIITLIIIAEIIGFYALLVGILGQAFEQCGSWLSSIALAWVIAAPIVGGYGIKYHVTKSTIIQQSQEQKQFAEMSQTWRVVEHIKPGLVRVQREIGKTTIEGYADRESGWHVVNEHEAAAKLPNLEDNKEGEHK